MAIAIFMLWRTVHCPLSMKSSVIAGWLICTAMKSTPAAMAARAAPRVRSVAVMGLLVMGMVPSGGDSWSAADAWAFLEPTKSGGGEHHPMW